MDTDSTGHRSDSSHGDLGKRAEFAYVHIFSDRGSLSDGRNRGTQPQGDPAMDQVFAFLTVASGYIIAFAAGAWIGQPVFSWLRNRLPF